MMHSDAVAAIGIAKRRGIGHIRHLSVTDLWIQEKIRCGALQLLKVHGPDNPADLFTKYVTSGDIIKHMNKLGMKRMEGRNEATPQLER